MDFLKVKIDGVDYLLKFTFNSAKLLENFELSDDMTKYPFKVFTVLSDLFFASMNWANDVKYTREETDSKLEIYLSEDGEPVKLLEDLMELMNKSAFFKKLLNVEEKPKQSKTRVKK